MKVAYGHFVHVQRQHWSIECYPRAIKQVCHAEKFFVRWKRAIGNHVFCALRAFLKLEEKRSRGLISKWGHESFCTVGAARRSGSKGRPSERFAIPLTAAPTPPRLAIRLGWSQIAGWPPCAL
jgi:hypothetical protein